MLVNFFSVDRWFLRAFEKKTLHPLYTTKKCQQNYFFHVLSTKNYSDYNMQHWKKVAPLYIVKDDRLECLFRILKKCKTNFLFPFLSMSTFLIEFSRIIGKAPPIFFVKALTVYYSHLGGMTYVENLLCHFKLKIK